MLNHIYRVIFNRSTGCYVAVSEITKSGGKSSRSGTVGTVGGIKSASTSAKSLRRHAIAVAIGGVLGLASMSSYADICITTGGSNNTSGSSGVFNAIGCGINSNAYGGQSAAMGWVNTTGAEFTQADFSSAIGVSNRTLANNSSAIGFLNETRAIDSSAIGHINRVTGGGQNGSALGSQNTVSANQASAIGYKNDASANNSLAVGSNATANIANSIALGERSVTTVNAGVSGFGAGTNTNATWKSTLAAVSVGNTSSNLTRQITGVAAGTADTDAVNVAQLKQFSAASSGTSNVIQCGSTGSSVDCSTSSTLNSDLIIANGANGGSLTVQGDANLQGTTTTQAIVNNGILSTDTLISNNKVVTNKLESETLEVDGQSTTNGIGNTGNITNSGNITNGGNIANTGSLTNTGATDLGDTLTVAGQSTTNGINNSNGLTNSGGLTNTGGLTSTGTTQLNGTLNATGATKLGDTLTVAGQSTTNGITNTGSLTSTGTTQLNGALNATGDTKLDGTLNVAGQTTTNGINNSGNTITGVGNGLVANKSTDAVNGDQLNTTNINVQANTTAVQSGLNFAGDDGSTINRQLDDQLNITGGATGTLTTANIGVSNDGNNGLLVQLAKNIDLGTDGSVETGATTVDNTGLTIANGPSITTTGIDAGTQQITQVASGGDITDDNNKLNAANIGDLQKVANGITNIGFNITTNSDINTKDNIKMNDTVDFTNTDGNLVVSNTVDNRVNYNLATNIRVESVTIGDGTNNTKLTTDTRGISVNQSKIVDVADGNVNATSQQAVNGRQLNATNQNVTDLINGEIGIVQQLNRPDGRIRVGATTGGTVVDFQNSSGEFRTLEGVAAGTVRFNSTDVINGSQLYYTAKSTAKNLGGGSVVNTDGTVSAPNYVLNDGSNTGSTTTVDNVGSALNNLDSRTTANTANIANKADTSYVNSQNAAQDVVINRKVDITVFEADQARQDAVMATKADTTYVDNGNNAQDIVIAQNTSRFEGLNERVNSLDKELSSGVASALAISSMPTLSIPGAHMITGGSGYFNGQGSLAIGMTGTNNTGKISYKIGGAYTQDGGSAFSIGGGYRWK